MQQIPVLAAERLLLRAATAADLDASAAMWADPEVVRHIGGKPSTREESWGRMLRSLGLWAALHYGYWVVEDRASGLYVGDVGFADFQREMEPALGSAPEMGWVLDRRWHGRGYASEAVAAAIAWGEANLDAAEYCCVIDPANAASLNVARKAGFGAQETALYKGEPILTLRRRRAG